MILVESVHTGQHLRLPKVGLEERERGRREEGEREEGEESEKQLMLSFHCVPNSFHATLLSGSSLCSMKI